MSRVPSLIAAALIMLLPSPTFAKTNAPASPDEIRRSLSAYAKGHPKTLIAVGMISGGKTRMYFVRGSQVDSTRLDDRALFEIGSVTKTFTATLLAQMVQSGAVRLNDPIQKYRIHPITRTSFNSRSTSLRRRAPAHRRNGRSSKNNRHPIAVPILLQYRTRHP